MIRPFAAAIALAVVLSAHARAETRDFDCLMEPAEQIKLGSPAAGLIEEVLVARGDAVTAGQLVARLNAGVEQGTVDLLRTRAESTAVIDAQKDQLQMVEKRFERVSELHRRGIATADLFEQVEAERIAAQSLLVQAELNRDIAVKELARAQAALGQRTLHSPIDGIVSARVLTAGEYVGSGDHVLEIVQLDPLRIEAFVPVSYYSGLTVGDRAVVRPVPPLTGAYDAVITTIDRVFDAASGTFVVIMELPNPDGTLPAGHRCRMEFAPDE